MKLKFKYYFLDVPASVCGAFGLVRYVPICVGGCYVDEKEENTIDLTDYSVVNKNKDYIKAGRDYVKSFMPYTPFDAWFDENNNDHAYIGKWPQDEKNIKIYYFVLDGFIRKMFATKYLGMSMSSLGGIQYIIEFNGNMLDCIPEEGDIIYSTKKEAEEALKNENKKRG